MPNVDIPGVGIVEFPDTMPADSINAASRRLYEQALSGQAAPSPAAPPVGSAESRITPQAPNPGAMVSSSDFYDYTDPGGVGGAGGPYENAGFSRMSDTQQHAAAGQGLTNYGTNAAFEAGGGLLGPLVAPVARAGARIAASPAVQDIASIFAPQAGAAMRTAGRIGKAAGRVFGKGADEAAATLEAAAPGGAAKPAAEKASEAGRALSEHRWGKGAKPGTAESRISKPDLRVVEGNAPKTKPTRPSRPSKLEGQLQESIDQVRAKKAGQVGTAESRVAKAAEQTSPRAKPAEGARHDVKYYSESKGHDINIEDMNQKHIESAFKKLAATNPKPGSVAARQLQALLKESIHRLQTTGIHIGQ